MLIGKYSKTGSYHKALEEENQDYVCSLDNEEFTAIMLADGATACKKGLDGARLACEAAAYMINTEGAALFDYPYGKSAYLLTEEILYNLECSKDESADISEYGSTFMLAMLEKKTGRALLVNLGDGAVILSEEKKLSVVMPPVRYGRNPCLTTTKGADRAMNIKTGYLHLNEKIVLCSDGFYARLCVEASKTGNAQNFLEQCLEGRIADETNADDSSCISLVRERK